MSDLTKSETISSMATRLIQEGLPNERVLEEVRRAFPDARTKMASILTYRKRLKQQGALTSAAKAAVVGGGSHGGARPGAGNRPGWQSRRSGDTTARKAAVVLAIDAAHDGETPVEFMLRVMRTEPPAKPEGMSDWDYTRLVKEWEDRRLDAAKSVAPYVHPRLAAVDHTGAVGVDVKTHEDALSELE